MPDSPPCSKDKHSAVMAMPYLWRENGWVEQQHKSQSGVLDTYLYGKGPSVLDREFGKHSAKISCCQCRSVMDQNDDADKVKVLNEQFPVLRE